MEQSKNLIERTSPIYSKAPDYDSAIKKVMQEINKLLPYRYTNDDFIMASGEKYHELNFKALTQAQQQEIQIKRWNQTKKAEAESYINQNLIAKGIDSPSDASMKKIYDIVVNSKGGTCGHQCVVAAEHLREKLGEGVEMKIVNLKYYEHQFIIIDNVKVYDPFANKHYPLAELEKHLAALSLRKTDDAKQMSGKLPRDEYYTLKIISKAESTDENDKPCCPSCNIL